MKKTLCILFGIVMLMPVMHYDTKSVEAKNTATSYAGSSSVINETKVSEQDLINKVKQKTNKPIYKTFYDDFDGDKSYEAFILVGTENDYESDYLDGEVWLSNSKKVIRLESGTFAIKSTNILNLKSAKLFCLGSYAGTSWPSELWKINGSEALKIFVGDSISYTGNDIMSVHSTYDGSLSDGILLGHTWKEYYFYYLDGQMYEYGAKKITEKQFSNIKNASSILEQIKTKYRSSKITEIFYRKNNTIQINFYVLEGESKYYYNACLNYDAKNNTVSFVQYGEGSYKTALHPEIAEYPEVPKNITNTIASTSLTGSLALQPDIVYNYDLNGDGKDESIKYSVKQSVLTATVSVYIDGKKVITEEQGAFTFYASLSNIDKKDKYIELSVMSYSGDNYMNTLNIYRYLGASKKPLKLFSFPSSNDILSLNFSDKVNTNGNGTFTWASGTIYSLIDYCEYIDANEGTQPLGACVDIQFVLKDNKIVLKSKEFKAYDSKVKTLKNIVLKDKASSNGKQVVSIKSGSTINIEKIKYIKKGEAYLYIKYGTKNGWYHVNEKSGVVFRK